MANSDVSGRREYISWSLIECLQAFRLETGMFVCQANMPALYKRDLTCQACTPEAENGGLGPVEDQDHLKVCPGYSSLWAGLGPMTTLARVQYFLKVDKKRRSKARS